MSEASREEFPGGRFSGSQPCPCCARIGYVPQGLAQQGSLTKDGAAKLCDDEVQREMRYCNMHVVHMRDKEVDGKGSSAEVYLRSWRELKVRRFFP
jgi:hypothetical protein